MSSNKKEDLGPPALKRRRIQEEITRHDDDTLYFANGNIVLLSLPNQDDGVVTAFKVYKDHLVMHSPVFEDMFLAPPPCDGVEEYDNAPLVRLHDEIVHLVPFLKAIYNPTAVPSKRDFYLSLDNAEAVFKLCEKYQCDKLLHHMQHVLLTTWPKDLRAWDLMNKADYVALLRMEEDLKDVADGWPMPDPYATVRLAQGYGVPAVLPAAFYELFRRSFLDAVALQEEEDAEEGEDAEDAEEGEEGEGEGEGDEDDGGDDDCDRGLMYLAQDDLCRVVRGCHAIRIFSTRLFDKVREVEWEHDHGKRGDETRSRCMEGMQQLIRTHGRLLLQKGDVLARLKESSIRSSKPPGSIPCEKAVTHYIKHMGQQRLKFWEALPQYFDLEA